MSEAGHRRPARVRPAPAPHRLQASSLGVCARAVAALAALAFGAAAIVPLGPAGAPATGHGVSARVTNDQIRAREWHLDVLRAQRAWKYTRGRGVTVAVLDTGVEGRHPDLTGQVLSGPDLTGGVRSPGTRYWGLHGTSMASIIAGHGHGPGASQGMLGVAPQSRVLSVRVTLENDDPLRRDNGRQGGGDRDAIAQGIRYAVDQGADIVNMSLGGGRQYYNGTASQESAIKYALDRGVVLIASAGNDGSGANRKNFPAAYPGVIAVGALDRELRLWKDSNRRSHVAVCAPGVDIVSADAGDGYVVGTGTSASSAMVAGVAALVRSRYPALSPEQVRQALIAGSPPRPGRPTGSPTCRGTVDAVRALVAAQGMGGTSGAPAESAARPPAADARASGGGHGLLVPLVVVGVVLVAAGLVLGLRQRGRRDEDAGDTDAVHDYGLPSTPPTPREREQAEFAEFAEPVVSAVPLWQSTEVRTVPPPVDPSPVDPPPIDPVDGSWGAPAPPSAPSPPDEPLFGASELRMFVPGEYVEKRHDDRPSGLTGSVWEDDADPLGQADPAEPDDEPKRRPSRGSDDEEYWW